MALMCNGKKYDCFPKMSSLSSLFLKYGFKSKTVLVVIEAPMKERKRGMRFNYALIPIHFTCGNKD